MAATRTAYRGAEKVKVRGGASPLDPDEQVALAFAAETSRISPATAVQCISAWIAKRAELSAGARLTENLAFDLGDAKLRGFVTAALPAIGGALTLPAEVAFFDLDREAVVELFTLGFLAVREAAVAAGEAPDFLTSDEIPF